ncbi:glycoside hydrolase family 25 protein [Angustibacter luteus]|uniref:Glycoside hydrolase family 25 protein n=1 Tax=Angustibacter luteus TaxID=658456 RepID=A0ABW1JB68_9ACTN
MPRHLAALRRARPLTLTAVVLAAAATALAGLAVPASAATSRPLGIDVSRWQSAGASDSCAAQGIDWSKVSATTRSFVFIRATRTKAAVTAQDACFDRNWRGAVTAGIYRGAYHYAIPSAVAGSAARDARVFVSIVGRMQDAGDLPPVLDLETSGGLKPAQLATWTRTWLTTVRSLTGRQPMIYTYPSFWRSAMADSNAFHAYPLWIANWTATPSVPGGWPTYAVHQYSATGRVAGISGDVDLNVFNGSAAQLRAFAHLGTHPTTATTSSTAYRGSAWRISGYLRTSAGTPVTGATVRLYRRVGAGPWALVASTRTSSVTAWYGFTRQPTTAATYKVRYSGGTQFAASWSYPRSHTIRDRAVVSTTLGTSAIRVRKGSAVTLSGRLTRAVNGAPLPGKRVVVYQRVGAGPWTVVRAVTTSAKAARFALTVRPRVAVSYRAVFAGSYANRPSASTVRAVRLR